MSVKVILFNVVFPPKSIFNPTAASSILIESQLISPAFVILPSNIDKDDTWVAHAVNPLEPISITPNPLEIAPELRVPTVVTLDNVSRELSIYVSKSEAGICLVVVPSITIKASASAIVIDEVDLAEPSSRFNSAAVDPIAVPLKLIASAYTVPSKYPSLNSYELEPKSTSLSVVGRIEPLLNVTWVSPPVLTVITSEPENSIDVFVSMWGVQSKGAHV